MNSLHFLDSSGTATAADVFADIDANVTANMWQLCTTNATIQQVILTPLDGVTASSTFSTGGPAKWKGSGGTDAILQGSIVVTLPSANRGPANRNRIYLPWIGETGQQDGTITPANLTAMQAAWTTFRAAMSTAGSPLVVVSPSLAVALPVTAPVVQPYLRVQRRRGRR